MLPLSPHTQSARFKDICIANQPIYSLEHAMHCLIYENNWKWHTNTPGTEQINRNSVEDFDFQMLATNNYAVFITFADDDDNDERQLKVNTEIPKHMIMCIINSIESVC